MPDPGTLQLPLDDAPESRRRRKPRARAGERGPERRTSMLLRPSDELYLDRLSDLYSDDSAEPIGIGETIRRALRDAAAQRGLDLAELEHEVPAAA